MFTRGHHLRWLGFRNHPQYVAWAACRATSKGSPRTWRLTAQRKHGDIKTAKIEYDWYTYIYREIHMYIYVHIYIFAYIYICFCISKLILLLLLLSFLLLLLYNHITICICNYMLIKNSMCIHTCMYIHIYIYVQIYIKICIYVYIYIHIYIYKHGRGVLWAPKFVMQAALFIQHIMFAACRAWDIDVSEGTKI